MGEEKGYSLSAPKGAGSNGSLKIWPVVALAIGHKPVPGSWYLVLGKSVTTLCRFLQLRDRMGRYGTEWDEHRGRGGGSAEKYRQRDVDLRQPYANRGLIAEVYANLG